MSDFGGGFSFDGNAGGFGGADPMGGGYMGGGGSQGPSPGSGKKGSKDRQTMTPVTIKQLMTAKSDHPDDGFKVDGVELHQVKIVGCVFDVEDQSTFTKFEIEDSTGKVEVKLWKDQEDGGAFNERLNACRTGVYVRAIGNVRIFQDVIHIVSHDIRPVEDPNELTHHLLETIYLHCVNTKGPLQPTQAASAWGAPAPTHGSNLNNSMMQEENNSGMSPVQQKVVQFFSANDTDDDDGTGLAVSRVVAGLQGQGVSEADVKDAIEFLANEGHLYSTIDDEHFKSTA
jgi:replication factor A2